jgi:flagellar secretion chaperone FliS
MSHEKYLEHETLSAPPQKLQLLLIEAALRQGHQAKQHWASQNEEAARKAIEHMQAIALQLLNGLSPDRSQPLVQRVAAIYSFLIRELASARLRRDAAALEGAIRVLETERETWWQVCQQLSSGAEAGGPPAAHFAQIPESISASRFSLDA